METVEIKGKRYVIGKLTAGEYAAIQNLSEIDSETGKIKMNFGDQMLYTVMYGVKQPRLSLSQVKDMDADVFRQLYMKILEVNTLPLPLSPEQSASLKERSRRRKESKE